MRTSVIISALLGVALVATFAPGAKSQGLGGLVEGLSGGLSGDSLVDALTKQLIGLWQTDELVLLDHYCNFQVKPTFRSWELYFKGTMWCPGWTPIRGQALTRSRTGVVNKAIQDFVKKALARGLINEEDSNAWLNA